MKTLIYLLVACVGYSIATGGTRDPNINDENYIDYGSKFGCVVAICGKEDDDGPYCASGVAIKPNWVLTAAHVIKRAKTCKITTRDKEIQASIFIPHKDFESNNFGYYDIGLIYCDEDLSVVAYPELYTESDEVGKICAMSGYGITGTFSTGAKIGDHKKRGGSNRIAGTDRHLLICNLKDQNTALEFLIASGDSGGGLFIDKKLAGINSCVLATDDRPDSTYGDESGHTRISQHIKWIQETISAK
jgi:hypothetical protein